MSKAGRSVYIRVNPKDCQSVVDVLKRVDILPRGMSFSQGVSIALASCLEGLRQAGVIPTRDGYDFNEVMAAFPLDRKADRVRKLDITGVIQGKGDFEAPPIIVETPERARRRLRYEELRFKLNNDALNFSEENRAELRPLVDEFFDFSIAK